MRKRQGFTLIELIVAMALTIFIMVILSQAFILSINVFLGLKGVGDMQENQRAAANALKFDLSQYHFTGIQRTSDPNFATPREGFFAINQDGIMAVSVPPLPQKNPPYQILLNGLYPSVLPGMTIWTPTGSTIPTGALVLPAPGIAGPPPQLNPPGFPGQTLVTISQRTTATLANNNPGLVIFSLTEGFDTESTPLPSSLSTFCTLHMTCRLKGNQQESFYTTPVVDLPNLPNPPWNLPPFFTQQTFYNMNPLVYPGLDADSTLRLPQPANPPYFYRSQWAEVFYFLGNGDPAFLNNPSNNTGGLFQPTGTTEEPLNPFGTGTPLYGLYRAQFVAVTDKSFVNPGFVTSVTNTTNPLLTGYPAANNKNYPGLPGLLASFAGLACNPSATNPPNTNPTIAFSTPEDIAGPAGRTITNSNPNFPPFGGPTNPWLNSWRPFSNSVSNATFPQGPLIGPTASLVTPNVLSFQVQGVFASGLSGDNVFYDSSNTLGARLMGVYITLRVWDNKTRQTRQMSIYQDL